VTWSIAAHDPATGAFAVAVATKAFAVGASCPFVRSGVGAVSTQSVTNRYLGPAVLDAMARGLPPDAAIESALAPRVALPGGGALTIEGTEAATMIDVDSGSV